VGGPPLGVLAQRLGHDFGDPDLLLRALTHASWVNEQRAARPAPGGGAADSPADNSILALIGDAALSLVVAEHLLSADPAATVSTLTSGRAEIVSDANLARWATALDLGPLLQLGRGLDQGGGRATASVLATALEAVLGALYLDDGLPAVRRAVAHLAVW
jgi:ribonuclease-3